MSAQKRFAKQAGSPHCAAFPLCTRSALARRTLGAERGAPSFLGAGESFWDARPFTRVVAWGRDFVRTKEYLELNRLEVKMGLPRAGARELLIAQARALVRGSPLKAIGFG
ncbi:MAG: hypothetical protein JST16_13120 [Bdellovibrionales bacterium]|nr:hypothetical protein [Bdellovibrionales bacterium]